MRSIFLMLALLPAAAASKVPPGDAFCETVRQFAQGAEEADPFRSLRNRRFEPRLGRAFCFFSDAQAYLCHHNLAAPDETRAIYAARIAACLPGSTRGSAGDHSIRYDVIRLGHFRARVREHGTDAAHVGRSIQIYFEAVPAA